MRSLIPSRACTSTRHGAGHARSSSRPFLGCSTLNSFTGWCRWKYQIGCTERKQPWLKLPGKMELLPQRMRQNKLFFAWYTDVLLVAWNRKLDDTQRLFLAGQGSRHCPSLCHRLEDHRHGHPCALSCRPPTTVHPAPLSSPLKFPLPWQKLEYTCLQGLTDVRKGSHYPINALNNNFRRHCQF